jgi:hypothetical protein
MNIRPPSVRLVSDTAVNLLRVEGQRIESRRACIPLTICGSSRSHSPFLSQPRWAGVSNRVGPHYGIRYVSPVISGFYVPLETSVARAQSADAFFAIESMNQLRAAPNQLTLLRLCIIPFLVLAVLDGHFRSAFTLFVLAGVTDGLDGLSYALVSSVSDPAQVSCLVCHQDMADSSHFKTHL